MKTMNAEIQKSVDVDKPEEVAKALNTGLSDLYTTYLKTQNFHWNYEGPRFHELHNFLEETYENLREQVDDVAERIRTLGFKAPGSFQEFEEMRNVDLSEKEKGFAAKKMITSLIESFERLNQTLKIGIHKAEECDDPVTADLLTEVLAHGEKRIWMLQSLNYPISAIKQ